jgi:hypothetical protein
LAARCRCPSASKSSSNSTTARPPERVRTCGHVRVTKKQKIRRRGARNHIYIYIYIQREREGGGALVRANRCGNRLRLRCCTIPLFISFSRSLEPHPHVTVHAEPVFSQPVLQAWVVWVAAKGGV